MTQQLKTGINQSRIASFLRCQQKHHYEYVENIVPRVTRPNMSLGTLTHEGLAAAMLWMSGALPTEQVADRTIESFIDEAVAERVEKFKTEHQLWDEEVEALEELAVKARALALRAAERFDQEYEVAFLPGVGPAIEMRLEYPLHLDAFDHVHGTLDLLAKERATGALWLLDWKVRKQLQPVDHEEVSIQMPAYTKMLAVLYNIRPVGSICFQVYADLPKQPKLNKDGSMSRSDLKTDWPTYRQALLDSGLDPADYMDMAAKLQDKEFFRLSRAYRTPEEVDNIWSGVVVRSAIRIGLYSDGSNDPIRNLNSMTCTGCQYRDLCLEELRGGDTDYIRQTDFQTRPLREGDGGDTEADDDGAIE